MTIDGTVTMDEEQVIWAPTTGLTPNSAHTATISWCGDEASIGFTVSTVGEPLETDVTGQTYALDLNSATWVTPTGLDTLIGDSLNMSILFGIEEASDILDFMGAIPVSGTTDQDFCVPTLDFDPISFERSPYFEVGPVDMPISMMGYSLSIYDMNISGTFDADGEGIQAVGLAGALDLRDIAPALGELSGGLVTDAASACDMLVMLGITCDDCPTDGESVCIGLELTDIDATATGVSLEIVAEADTHPECVPSEG
jgi:hypothetical protein